MIEPLVVAMGVKETHLNIFTDVQAYRSSLRCRHRAAKHEIGLSPKLSGD